MFATIRNWRLPKSLLVQRILINFSVNIKALHGSAKSTAGGGSTFIAQATIFSAALVLSISQACYASGENLSG